MTPTAPFPIFIGWDAAQMRAWNVAAFSLKCHVSDEVRIARVAMTTCREQGFYTRPTQTLEHGYFDEISNAPMSTGHAIARFLVPRLCNFSGWALFTDGDVLFRDDVVKLFALADPDKAVHVVQHAAYQPSGAHKMEGQAQTAYARKNWSSVMLFNCAHPSNRALDVGLVNRVPGRDLHRFCWLTDGEIGALPARWNALIGEEPEPDPAVAHFTRGVPDMPGYEHQPFADEWFAAARGAGYRLTQPPKPVEALA